MDSSRENTIIPITTIARIFKEMAFRNDNTRITQNTLQLSSEYIKLFINEAIIRSNEERLAEGDSLTKVDGIDNINEDGKNGAANDEIGDDDIDMEEDDIESDNMAESNTQRQTAYKSEVHLGTDTLDSRHLSKAAGILVLDF